MELSCTSTTQLIELKQLIDDELKRRKPQIVAMARLRLKKQLNAFGEDDWHKLRGVCGRSVKTNIKELRALRGGTLKGHPNDRVRYLKCLMKQDWSFLFPPGDSSRNYYVYSHCDPREPFFCGPVALNGVTPGIPFYVGKGKDKRAWDMKRNQGHGLRIRQVLSSGYQSSHIVHVFKNGLTEAEAFELESKLVYFFGTIYEQSREGILLNLDQCPRPVFTGYMEKLDNRWELKQKSSKDSNSDQRELTHG